MKASAIPMRELFADVSDTEAFGFRLREFLDRFREQPSFDLIAEEPALLSPAIKDEGKADAFLASTAVFLAQKHSLPIPDWAKGTARALVRPWFAANSHNLRMILLQESPTAFRVRNIFVSANALSRA